MVEVHLGLRMEGDPMYFDCTYQFRLQLLFKHSFPLMQLAEAIDLVLILTTHFGLLAASRGLVFFRELR